MKLIIVAVRDRAADAFMRPYFVPALGLAIRSFQDEVNRSSADNPMWVHPEDFDLYELGTYDEDRGVFEQKPDHPKQIAIGKQQKMGNGNDGDSPLLDSRMKLDRGAHHVS